MKEGYWLFITTLAICLIITNTALANKEIEPYSQETCQKIYESIGTFVLLADKEWKKKKERQGMLYSTAASNYATIYETVCRK